MKIAKALSALVSAALLAGCAIGLGPRAIHNERPVLLNLVRLRYNDTPLFLELGSVANAKITFSLLSTLFQLQATTASGKSPVLTLPVGN